MAASKLNQNALKHGIFSKHLNEDDKELFYEIERRFRKTHDVVDMKQEIILQKIIKLEVVLRKIEESLSGTQNTKHYLFGYYNMFLTQQRKWLDKLEEKRKEYDQNTDIAFVIDQSNQL